MGGFGSGNWHRWRSRLTVESLPEIDVRQLRGPGGSVIVRARDELAGGRIYRYLRDGPSVLLVPDSCDAGRATGIVLTLEATPCRFGGLRYWLRCPNDRCGGRVQSLFVGPNGTLACRKCHGLCYESQYGGEIERRFTRLRSYQRSAARGTRVDVERILAERAAILEALDKIERGHS